MQERRTYERFEFVGSVNIKSQNGCPCTFSGSLINISFSGFTMYAQEKIEVSKIVEFELMMNVLDEPLVGKGKVIYVNALAKEKTNLFCIGIEFIDVNKGIIMHLMKRLQLKIAHEARDKKRIKPLDFLPF
jgi:hypothetical protein